MQCPYCFGEIVADASTCRHCGKDIYVLMPILRKMAALSAEVSELRTLVHDNLPVAPLQTGAHSTIEHTSALTQLQNLVQADLTQAQIENETGMGRYVRDTSLYLIFPLLLLLSAYAVVVYLYELRPFYLHLASLLIPLPFGLILFARRQRHGLIWSLLFAGMALLAVFSMNAISGILEDMPIYPKNAAEWRESFEFSISILCSALTGILLGRIIRASILRNREQRITTLQRALVTSSKLVGKSLSPASVQKWSEYISRIGMLGTALTSIYTGLKNVM